jgi:hypothetical protein
LNYIISEIDNSKDRKIYLTRNEIIKNKIKESSIKGEKIIHYSLDGEVLSEYTSMRARTLLIVVLV